ncbi:hypothetical protein [Synechococcus sp. CCY9202]|uniref:hypothetical protein n=1 Tax=Synechococcus sp. CCY9202 TaxID=174698 RepID=UPI002B21FCB0|nr:hypothetical protein [Synechococcus sp. CCY9202]MEA5423657.1 hypothetical protein [Synechococcus sp. CCY9202]
MECCSGLRSGEISTPLAAVKMALRNLARRIQQLDRLTMQHCPELRNTDGVGVDISATLVVAVGDNQERMKSEAFFPARCGGISRPRRSSGLRCRDRDGAAEAPGSRSPAAQGCRWDRVLTRRRHRWRFF